MTQNTQVQAPVGAAHILQVIQNTPANKIALLEQVKKKFVQNYNLSHGNNLGELMYQRQLIFFNQQINDSDKLKKCDPFSLYACFVTAGVQGYSFDPADNEVYIIPRGGKAYLQRQAPAHVKRLIRTNQVKYAEQATIVYTGDVFLVRNGRVVEHTECFQSDRILAAYIKFVLDDRGTERHFIYRKSDWETWRKKSGDANGDNWNMDGQPAPGFLRTKVVLHACKEKCWASGQLPIEIERYEDIEVDEDETPDGHNHVPFIPDEPHATTENTQTEQTPPAAEMTEEQNGQSSTNKYSF